MEYHHFVKYLGGINFIFASSHDVVSIEPDIHFIPDPDALRNTLREPLPPKQPIMPPKWLVSPAPDVDSEGPPRTPSNHPATQYSSPSATLTAASKPVRCVSSAGVSTQHSSSAAPTSTSQVTKQPPLPPPKPVNRNNAAMMGKLWRAASLYR